MKYILDNDPEPLCLHFTATRDHFGEVVSEAIFSYHPPLLQVTEVELKSGGSAIAVTETNKQEYVSLVSAMPCPQQ